MIIWLASYPRSGNTFFRMVLNHRYGIQTLSVYEDRKVGLDGISDIVGHADASQHLEDIASSDELYFVKTHEPPHDYNPAIYLIRDGRDAIASYTQYKLSFKRSPWMTIRKKFTPHIGLRVMKDLVLSYDDYGGWSWHVQQWRQRPGTVIILKYEDLLKNPLEKTDRVIRQLGAPMKPVCLDPMPEFKQLHSASPHFFRKGRSGSWRDEMPDRLHELFWQYHGQVMTELGYSRS